MRKPYKTDLTDAQWEFIAPILPPAVVKNGFPPTDLREVVNTLLYQTRTGVQWDYLPHDLAPKSTASDYYRRWAAGGTLQRVLDAARRQAGRAEEPTAGAIDGQSVRAAVGESKGVRTDGGKKVRGRKRHTPTDTLGLLLCVVVTAADVSGGRARPGRPGPTLAPGPGEPGGRVRGRPVPRRGVRGVVRRPPGGPAGVDGRPAGAAGFVPTRKRWVWERTFGWVVANRRWVREYEKRVWSSEARVKVAASGMMRRRLKSTDGMGRGSMAVGGTNGVRARLAAG